MDRRRLLVSALGAGVATAATPWLAGAAAASEDELAFANFGASAEYLLKDFYVQALGAKVVPGSRASALKQGRSAAAQHAKALSDLLVGAGDAAPAEEDFEFEWPANAFRSEKAIVATGLGVLHPVLGVYQTAASAVSDSSYRVLYASLGASAGLQIGALAAISGQAAVRPFPVAMDLETASGALEAYLG